MIAKLKNSQPVTVTTLELQTSVLRELCKACTTSVKSAVMVRHGVMVPVADAGWFVVVADDATGGWTRHRRHGDGRAGSPPGVYSLENDAPDHQSVLFGRFRSSHVTQGSSAHSWGSVGASYEHNAGCVLRLTPSRRVQEGPSEKYNP
eukprot:1179535-Prorocentrum_minimum.AAC.2